MTGTERSSVLGGKQEEKAHSEPSCGRAFHARAAATGNDLSPRVERRVDGTSRVNACRVCAMH